MSMRILIINSSFRKMNTYKILTQIEQLLKKSDTHNNVEIINLFDYKIENCIGCRKCITNGGQNMRVVSQIRAWR
jgi:multimeric flavodoxin WrbA